MLYVLFGLAVLLGVSRVQAADHVVVVGKAADGTAALVFSSSNITAQAGDRLVFQFQAGDHSATQSSFNTPCEHLDSGFDSGLMPGSSTSPPMYNVTVNDTSTIWVYCRQGDHCSDDGMVFAANAPTTGSETFDAFQQLAMGKTPAQASTTAASSTSTAESTSGSAAASSAASAASSPSQASTSSAGTSSVAAASSASSASTASSAPSPSASKASGSMSRYMTLGHTSFFIGAAIAVTAFLIVS